MIEAVLTDIEGTTSSLDYVRRVMFPYSRERLESFLREHWEEEKVKAILKALEKSLGKPVDLRLAVETFREWIDRDSKEPLLKELQGHIWEQGFLSGELQGHIYEDAYESLKKWKKKGYRLFVYSSGSVKTQELFFSHTPYGDLRGLFEGFFDTSVGSKKEVDSYRRIAQRVGLPPESFLFLSDVEEELSCAHRAGMEVVLVSRDGSQKGEKFRVIGSFSELEL
ncbi:MAG: acireductone synthase [Aquificaceae bacterium]|nr:acireductone synthase [Aquificaceae bacterium]MCX8060282.1 acireductone synthase [Aquificaceae bacterium]MDW8097219.1 acireductone synthase [Aquificaceae bacterium]